MQALLTFARVQGFAGLHQQLGQGAHHAICNQRLPELKILGSNVACNQGGQWGSEQAGWRLSPLAPMSSEAVSADMPSQSPGDTLPTAAEQLLLSNCC